MIRGRRVFHKADVGLGNRKAKSDFNRTVGKNIW